MSQPLTWSKKYKWPVKNQTGPKLTWNGMAPETTIMSTTSTDTPIIVNITPETKAAIIAKTGELADLITFGVGLSNEERQKILKLGTKTVGWDEKCAGYMASRPDLIPSYVDMAALGQNRQVRLDLGDIIHVVMTTVVQKLTDTQMQIGHQILKPELAFYNSAQEAAKHGVPGAQNIADDLSDHFLKPGAKAKAAAKNKPAQ